MVSLFIYAHVRLTTSVDCKPSLLFAIECRNLNVLPSILELYDYNMTN